MNPAWAISSRNSETGSARCVFSTHPNHTIEILRESRAYDGVIAVGGDGTISEVVNGMADEPRPLGIIPAGTSNGLARDLGLSETAAALRALQHPRFGRLDVISVRLRQQSVWRKRRMISTSAVGYIAGATEVAYRCKQRLHLLSHFVGAVWQPFRQREFPIRLRFDQESWQEHQVTSVAVHNTQFIGTFRLFPEALVDDGLLNVLHGKLSALGQLLEDLGILVRRPLFVQSVHRAARRLEIEIPGGGTVMVDGDLYPGVEAIEYVVEPAWLSCCTAAEPVDQPDLFSITPAGARSRPAAVSPGSGPTASLRSRSS